MKLPLLIAALFAMSACSTGVKIDPAEIHQAQFEDDRLYVPIQIEGRTFQFLLDTGAGRCSINKKLAKELNLEKIGNVQYAGAQRKWRKADLVLARDIVFGNL